MQYSYIFNSYIIHLLLYVPYSLIFNIYIIYVVLIQP
jgi:hypothetical protein